MNGAEQVGALALVGVEDVARGADLVIIATPDAAIESVAARHAGACIASNHLVALLGQVERVSPVPLEALLPLMRATLENVGELGSAAALTGPVARGDVETVRAHLEALPASEHDAYRALARVAHQLSRSGARERARSADAGATQKHDDLDAVIR